MYAPSEELIGLDALPWSAKVNLLLLLGCGVPLVVLTTVLESALTTCPTPSSLLVEGTDSGSATFSATVGAIDPDAPNFGNKVKSSASRNPMLSLPVLFSTEEEL